MFIQEHFKITSLKRLYARTDSVLCNEVNPLVLMEDLRV